MTDKYPVEALLRPPVEIYAAITYAMISAVMIIAPSIMMMTPDVAYVSAFVLGLLSVRRFKQAHRIRKYQKGLLRLPEFKMNSNEVPVSHQKLFLGKGFRWNAKHTQRLHDIRRREGLKYIEPGFFFKLARKLEYKLEYVPLTKWLVRILKSQRFHLVNPPKKKSKTHKGILFAFFMALSRISVANPVAPLPPVGGAPEIHAVGLWEGEDDVLMDLGERVGHTIVIGTTRVGKTRLAEILITQDIRRGDVVIVFDPKNDADLFKRIYNEARIAGRLDNLYFFNLGYPEISARYNTVGSFARVTEVASRIAGQMPGEGQSAAFREFVWRYVNVIAKTLNALGRKVDIEQIKSYAEDIEPLTIDYLEDYLYKISQDEAQKHKLDANWKSVISLYEISYKEREDGFKKTGTLATRNDRSLALVKYCEEKKLIDLDSVCQSLVATFKYDPKHLEKLTASLMPLMEKLTTGKCAELISPDYLDKDDQRPIFTWKDIIRTGGIVYVGLDALSDPEVAAAVGNSMFADLTSVSGAIYKHGINHGLPDIDGLGESKRKINIHADEFNELIGDSFIPLLNKAGGAGFQVTAYTQTWSDVQARLGNHDKAGQVAGNFNTMIMLRVLEQKTAEMFTNKLNQVEINHLTLLSGTTDNSDPDSSQHFVSKTEQRNTTQTVDLIEPGDFTRLPKGQAFALLEGGKAYKIRLPLPDDSDLEELPSKLTTIVDDMREQYKSCTADWYKFQDSFKEAA